jgi:serine/threonine protein kinase
MIREFRNGVPPEPVSAFTGQLLQAVAYCHNMGITHRDIKPANILQSASGTIKLSDFGSAIVASNVDETQVAGTPAYMPPEILDVIGNKHLSFEFGKAHDIWSIGCTVHELLTGKQPWSHLGLQPVQLVMKLKSLKFHIEESLPNDAKDFISSCLQTNMMMRPSANDLILHSFVLTSRSQSPENGA